MTAEVDAVGAAVVSRLVLEALLDEVDAAGLRATWLVRGEGLPWWCVVVPADGRSVLPPHIGEGPTGVAALADALRFLRRLGVVR